MPNLTPEDFDISDLYHPSGKYTPEEKLRAVNAYLVTGSSIQAGKVAGIPHYTIRKWKQEATWWPETVQELRKQLQDKLDGLLTGVIHDCIENLAERVTKGEQTITKDGRIVTKKVSARDLAIIAGTMFDKRALIRGDPTSRHEKISIESQLTQIAHKLEDWTRQINAKTINGKVEKEPIEDGVFEEARGK